VIPAREVKGPEAWLKAVAAFAAERPLEAEAIRATRYLTHTADAVEIALPENLKHKIAAFTAPRNLPILERVLAAEFGTALKIAFLPIDKTSEPLPPAQEVPGPAKGAGAATGEPRKTADPEFKNDPLIREALELFQARLVNQK